MEFQRLGLFCQCRDVPSSGSSQHHPALGSQSLQRTSSWPGGPGRCGDHQGSVSSSTASREPLMGMHTWRTGSVLTHTCCHFKCCFIKQLPSLAFPAPAYSWSDTSSDIGASKINNLSVAGGNSQPDPEPAALPGDHWKLHGLKITFTLFVSIIAP